MAQNTGLFSLEVCVDTVDFISDHEQELDVPIEKASKMAGCDLCFMFYDYPAIIVTPPTASLPTYVSSNNGEKRIRVLYQTGQSVLFEENPFNLASKLTSQPITLLAVGPIINGTSKRDVHGSSMISLEQFIPPQTESAGRHRFGYLRGSWGCCEMAIPLKDYSGCIIAVALIVISLSAIDPTIKTLISKNNSQPNNQTTETEKTVNIEKNSKKTSPLIEKSNIVPPIDIPANKFSSKEKGKENAPNSGQGSLIMSFEENSPFSQKPNGSGTASSVEDIAITPNLTPPHTSSHSPPPSSSSPPPPSSLLSSSLLSSSSEMSSTMNSQLSPPFSQDMPVVGDVLSNSYQSHDSDGPSTQSSPIWISGDGEGEMKPLRVSASGTGLKSSFRMSGSGLGLGHDIDIQSMKASIEEFSANRTPQNMSVNYAPSSQPDEKPVYLSQPLDEDYQNTHSDTQPITEHCPTYLDHSSGGDGFENDQEGYCFQPRPLFLSNTPPLPRLPTTQDKIEVSTNPPTNPPRPEGLPGVMPDDTSLKVLQETLGRIEAKLASSSSSSGKATQSLNHGAMSSPRIQNKNQVLEQVMEEMGHLGDQSILRQLFVEIAKLQAESLSHEPQNKKYHVHDDSSTNKLTTGSNNEGDPISLRRRTLPIRSRPQPHRYAQSNISEEIEAREMEAHVTRAVPPIPPPFTPGIEERVEEWFLRNQDEEDTVDAQEYFKLLATEMNQTEDFIVSRLKKGDELDQRRLFYSEAMNFLSQIAM